MFPKKTSYAFTIVFWAVTTLTALCISFYVLPIYIMDKSIYDVRVTSDSIAPIRQLSAFDGITVQAASTAMDLTTNPSTQRASIEPATEMCSGGCMGLDVATIQIIGGVCSSLCASESILTSNDCSCGSCCKGVVN